MKKLALLLILAALAAPVSAASISYSQSGANSNTVMKGRTFTVTVSGLTGTGSARIILPIEFSLTGGENETKTFSSSTSSLSWTTVIAGQTVTGKTISVTISTTGSPVTVTTDSFNVILPPSLSGSVDPTGKTVSRNSNFTLSLNLQNIGETNARDVSIILYLPSDASLLTGSSIQTISSIAGGAGGSGESKSVSWAIKGSSAGNGIIIINVTPSNADALTKSLSFNVSSVCGDLVCEGSETYVNCLADCIAPVTTTSGSYIAATNTTTTANTTSSSTSTTTTVMSDVTATEKNVSVFIPEIGADASADVNVNNTLVRKLVITVNSNVKNVSLNIKAVSKPVPEAAPGLIKNYLSIAKENISDSNITSVRIEFVVEKSWVTENNIDTAKVYLYRYNGSWTKLTTEKVRDESDYLVYRADSPGLSYFAISGEALPVSTSSINATTTSITSETSSDNGVILMVIILIVAMMAVAYYKFGMKKEKEFSYKYKPKQS